MNIEIEKTNTSLLKTSQVPRGHLFTIDGDEENEVYLKIRDGFVMVGHNEDNYALRELCSDKEYEYCNVNWKSLTPINIKLT